MQLLYIADPLCSWCYGFGPELSKVLMRHPGARLDLVMGGLRPYNTEPMSGKFRDMLLGHWKHVAEASGLAFNPAALEQPGFVYDTEPSCRAVVTARSIDAARAFAYLKLVQAAFYGGGIDVTRLAALADIAAQCGYERDSFLTRLESPEMRDETRTDFSTAQSLGVSGFPTLGVSHGRELFLVTNGYSTADVIEQRLAEIERLALERRAAAGGS